MENIKINFG